MAIIFIRTIILYFSVLISLRLMGKRQLGEMEISEFIVAALIADLAATPLQDIGIPLLNGLVPIITLFCLEVLIAGLSSKSVKLRGIFFGKPCMIIEKGKISIENMHINRFTPDELMQELRAQGIASIDDIEYGVLETNGKLSVLLSTDSQPLTEKALKGENDSGYPHIIINEGRILDNNLRLLGRDRRWLDKRLGELGAASGAEGVFLLTLTETGKLFYQAKEKK